MFAAFRHKLARGMKRVGRAESFARSESGATAVEFALVAAPFFAMLMALFQTALVFFASRVLDETTEMASRHIMTGQAQQANMSQAGFQSFVCTQTYALFNCNNFLINVQSYASFSSATTSSSVASFNSQGQPVDSNGNTVTMNYSPGNPGDIVVVQVMYQWPVVLGPLGFNLANMGNGNRLLVSTAVFKNEPY
jgi:Flp pilus assembly protein TadG